MDENEVKLFCTTGRGTELFVEEELRDRLQAKILKRVDGKVFFSLNHKSHSTNHLDLQSLTNLKTVERIFLELNSFKTSRLPYGKGKGQFLNALKRRLVKEEKFLQTEELFKTLNTINDIVNSSEDQLEPENKKPRLDHSSSQIPTFRVSCKISGNFSKLVSAQELNKELAKIISKMTKWKPDLKNPQFEVSIHINDEMVVAGIPIISEPISKRGYILYSGLRSPITWIMVHLTHIQPNDVVLDPVCGKATILIEAVKSLQTKATYIGIDKNITQLNKACSNLQYADVKGDIHLLQADGLDLPVKSEYVDKIICDAPFDEKHRILDYDIKQFYNQLLHESYRVLKDGGRMVLLTSSKLHPTVLELLDSHQNYGSGGTLVDTSQHTEPLGGDSKEHVPNLENDKTENQNFTENSCNCDTSNKCDNEILDISNSQRSIESKTVDIFKEVPSRNGSIPLNFVEDYYIKLGETHAYIIVVEKENK